MPGDYNATVYDATMAERVVDRLIYAESMTLPVMVLSRVLECKDSHLLSALRALEGAGTITTSGSSRKHPGLPAMVRLRSAPNFGRAKEAAARMRQPPPKRQRGKRASYIPVPIAVSVGQKRDRTAARAGRAPTTKAPPPPPARREASRLPPVAIPTISRKDMRAGRLAIRGILDKLGRQRPCYPPFRILRLMEDGRHVSVASAAQALGHSPGQTGTYFKRLRGLGLIAEPIGKGVPLYHLTPVGFAAAHYAARYQDAWTIPLCATMTTALRVVSIAPTPTSADIAMMHGCAPTTAREATRKLREAGLIIVISGDGLRANPHHYGLTTAGRRALVCV